MSPLSWHAESNFTTMQPMRFSWCSDNALVSTERPKYTYQREIIQMKCVLWARRFMLSGGNPYSGVFVALRVFHFAVLFF